MNWDDFQREMKIASNQGIFKTGKVDSTGKRGYSQWFSIAWYAVMIHPQTQFCMGDFTEAPDISLRFYCMSLNQFLQLERACKASWCVRGKCIAGAGDEALRILLPAASVGQRCHYEPVLGILKLHCCIKIEKKLTSFELSFLLY